MTPGMPPKRSADLVFFIFIVVQVSCVARVRVDTNYRFMFLSVNVG